jgi:hypothetical protein
MTKSCEKHPDGRRFPSGGCRECNLMNARARRARLRAERGPKALSARQRAIKTHRKY